jgi:pimeloyl-ACP methyl ester carboxylesterase
MNRDDLKSSSDILRTTVDGRPVRYRARRGDAADAPPLLCVHGLACSSDVWRPLLRCAESDSAPWTVLAPDMPGYGCEAGTAEARDMLGLADWLARFIDALGIDRVHVAGHSMGCQVALALAKHYPDRVDKLILASPTAGCRHCPAGRYAAGILVDGLCDTAAYSAALLRMTAHMGPRRYARTVAHMMRHDSFEGIERIAAPTLVVRGRHDPIVSDRLARRLAEALPQGELRTVGGVAHAVPFTKPKQFLKIVQEFLSHCGTFE